MRLFVYAAIHPLCRFGVYAPAIRVLSIEQFHFPFFLHPLPFTGAVLLHLALFCSRLSLTCRQCSGWYASCVHHFQPQFLESLRRNISSRSNSFSLMIAWYLHALPLSNFRLAFVLSLCIVRRLNEQSKITHARTYRVGFLMTERIDRMTDSACHDVKKKKVASLGCTSWS